MAPPFDGVIGQSLIQYHPSASVASIPFLHRFIAISRRIIAADGWTIDDREWMMELAHCRCLSLAKVIADKADDNAMACYRVQWWFAVNSISYLSFIMW